MAQYVLDSAPSPTFALAGHSMGGIVALEIMRLAPQRVERLALLCASATPVAPGDAGAKEHAGRMAQVQLAQTQGMRAMGAQCLRGMVHPDAQTGPVFDALLDMVERCSPAQFATHVNALLCRPDATSVLPTITCPTLVLCGREDRLIRPELHHAMAQSISHATLQVVEHCGHMATLERPAEVGAALAQWLAR
jgi:pimeloyl-ACP methyl ester carboxylesterase